MRIRLLALILLVGLVCPPVGYVQSDVTVVKRFAITAPYGYQPAYYGQSWSPDNTLLALEFVPQANSPDSLAYARQQVYDVQTGELVNEFADLIAWSADSRRVVVRRAYNAPPQILDARTGAQLAILADAGQSFAYDVVRSPSPFVITGHVLPNLDRNTNVLRFYDDQTGALLYTLTEALELPVYTHDLTRFAVSTTTGVQVYDAARYALLYTLEGFVIPQPPPDLWSPDDRHLRVAPQQTYPKLGPLNVWTPGGALSAPIYNATGTVAWSPDGSLLAVPTDYGKIFIYDAETGSVVETLRGFPAGQTFIEHWTGTAIMSITGDYQFTGFVLSIWDTGTRAFLFHGGVDLGWSYRLQGDTLAIFEKLSGFRYVRLSTGETIHQLPLGSFFLYLSPDERWIAGTGGEPPDSFPLYRIEPFELVATLPGNGEEIVDILWSSDSHYLVSLETSSLIVWEIVEG